MPFSDRPAECLRHGPGAPEYCAEVFTNDAKRAGDMQTSDRYNAARAAALTSSGQGNDADKLDDKERTRLRQQAATW